jgi:hypothetical protein
MGKNVLDPIAGTGTTREAVPTERSKKRGRPTLGPEPQSPAQRARKSYANKREEKRRQQRYDDAVKMRDNWFLMEANLDLQEPTRTIGRNYVEKLLAWAENDLWPSLPEAIDDMRQLMEIQPDIIEAIARKMKAAGIDRPDFIEIMARVMRGEKIDPSDLEVARRAMRRRFDPPK